MVRPPEARAVWHPRDFRLGQAVVVEVVPSEQAHCLAEARVQVLVRLLPFCDLRNQSPFGRTPCSFSSSGWIAVFHRPPCIGGINNQRPSFLRMIAQIVPVTCANPSSCSCHCVGHRDDHLDCLADLPTVGRFCLGHCGVWRTQPP